MHRMTLRPRHAMTLAVRAPHADGDQPTRSTSTTRRKASSTKAAGKGDDSHDDDDDLLTGSVSTATTSRKKNKTKATSTVSTSGSSAILKGVSSGVVQTYDSSAYLPGGSASAVLADAAASASSSGASSSGSGLPKPALYAIIGGGSVVALAAAVFFVIFCYKRKKEMKQEDEWTGYSPNAAFRASMAPGPGKGPGARGQRLADDDEASFGVMEKNTYAMDLASPMEEKQTYDFHTSFPGNPATPQLAYNNGFYTSGAPLTPSHPDYIPARPPRPSEQYSFASSPIKTVQHQAPATANSSNGMNTYQRNLLALTSSMSFDNPAARAQAQAGQGAPPETSPFADTQAVPVARKASKKINHKKDTIIGFAESYADDDSEIADREDTIPTQPLNFNTLRAAHGRLGEHMEQDAEEGRPRQQPLSKSSDIAPSLSTIALPNSASSSMRDLENVLDSFGYETGTQIPESIPTLGNRAPHRGALVENVSEAESSGTSSAKSGYRITRPGAAVGISLVSNINSIHSTAGDIGEVSPVQTRLPSSATSPNLAALASSGNAVKAGLPRSTTSPALASRRRSIISNGNSMGPSRNVPALVRTDSRNSTGEVLVPANGRASIMTFETNAEEERLAFSSPFGLEEDAKLARALSLSRKAKPERSGSIRQRSNSVSQKLASSSRQPRSRTSTAYGGQMPPTPAIHSGRSRTMTTESEAVFAVGSNMLAASPDELLKSPPFVPYLQSPDFLVQPPSPSQGSDITSFSALDKEREYHRQLAENGFVPLAQMALSANGPDRHYRSPIDSIVGVFEYDDPGHSALLAARTA